MKSLILIATLLNNPWNRFLFNLKLLNKNFLFEEKQ